MNKLKDQTIVFSEWLNKTLKKQGRKATWMAEQMGISYQMFLVKKRENKFTVSEKFFIQHILKED